VFGLEFSHFRLLGGRITPESGGATPAVALTAYARAEDRMKAVMASFQHHVAKPVEPAELVTMVSSLSKNVGSRGLR
jgi:CheY-like chemotaxis protein